MSSLKLHIALLLVITVWLMISCVDHVDLDLPSKNQLIVISGWVTNMDEDHKISIKRTTEFNSTEPYPPVNGAEVYLLDRIDTRIDFVERDSSGEYFSNKDEFIGVPGDAYELHVLTQEGHHIVSKREPLRPLPSIDTVMVRVFANPEYVDIELGEDNFYLNGIIVDEVGINNYYRWKILVNGVLRNKPTELVLFDDKFTDGNEFSFDASNVLFNEKDDVQLYHMSMTGSAHKYYSELKKLTGTTIVGPSFQASSLKGNLVDINSDEDILGYFGASEVEVVEVQTQPR